MQLERRENDLFDLRRFAGFSFNLDIDSAKPDIVLSELKLVGNLMLESLDRDFLSQANNRVIRTSHTDVRNIGRPFWQDARIGGRDVCMRADQRADASLEMPGESHFFRRRLGMHIDQNHFRLVCDLADRPIRSFERIVDRLHKRSPLQVDDADVPLLLEIIHNEAESRVFLGVVQWPQQVSFGREQGLDLPPVPDMVAAGDYVDTQSEKFFCVLLGNALAFIHVFAVGDAEIDIILLDVLLEHRRGEGKAGSAVNITDKENVQMLGHVDFQGS